MGVLSKIALTVMSIKSFEFELRFGINSGAKFNGVNTKTGIQLFMEARLNLQESPIDIGLQFSLGMFDREGNASYLYDHHVTP